MASDRLTAEELAELDYMAGNAAVTGPLLRKLIAAAERAEKYEKALRHIRTGKTQADNEHPLGEWASMSMRFHSIARTALEEAP